MLVWMSTSSTVAPLPVNLVYRGKDNAFMKTGLEPGLPVYFRVAFYDTFGESGLNVSSSVSATPTATGGITRCLHCLPTLLRSMDEQPSSLMLPIQIPVVCTGGTVLRGNLPVMVGTWSQIV